MIDLVLAVAVILAFIRITDIERDRNHTVSELNKHLARLNERLEELEKK